MNLSRFAAVVSLFAASFTFSGTASADAIPYPTSGVQNPVLYSFTAAATGNITAYFYGSTAGYTNELTMLVNGVATGIQGLNNHTSSFGQSLVLGAVNAGDTIVFKMINISPGGVGPWYSDKTMNSDGVNHIYATSFSGSGPIPVGTYVSFEDLAGGGDFNYNDENFVFTNVATTTNVPEPGSLALLGFGLAGLGFSRRRKLS